MNNHRLEINDLIDSAVNNAVARRHEALASVSDEEAKNVSGGIVPIVTPPPGIAPFLVYYTPYGYAWRPPVGNYWWFRRY